MRRLVRYKHSWSSNFEPKDNDTFEAVFDGPAKFDMDEIHELERDYIRRSFMKEREQTKKSMTDSPVSSPRDTTKTPSSRTD